MKATKRLNQFASLGLIGAGLVTLALNFLFDWQVNIAWPLVTMMLGVACFLLASALSERRALASLLHIPGALLAALGAIFLLNILTGDWNAWAYAWLLAVAGLGVGVLLANRRLHWPAWINLAGAGMVAGGVTLAVLFGAIAGGRFIQVIAPILLVAGGLSVRWLHLERYLPESWQRRLQPAQPAAAGEDALLQAPTQAGLPEALTPRELEVLVLIERGLSNPEIAARLTLAPSTVKTHINNIYGKLGVQTRIQAIRQGRESGLL